MLVGYLAFEPTERRRSLHPIFFLLFSTALMILNLRWKRISEYWPPFAILFAGFTLKPWLDGYRPYLSRLPSEVQVELEPFFDRRGTTEKEPDLRDVVRVLGALLVAAVLSVFLVFNILACRDEIKQSEGHNHYRAGAEWMRTNIPPGQIIFNTDWDDFPRLFYYDDSHYYVSGLDPSYLYEKDPNLSRLYDRITLGQEENPAPLIRDRFGARYVFSDNNHHEFFEHARLSGWFDIVYEDTECTILYIRDEKLDETLGFE